MYKDIRGTKTGADRDTGRCAIDKEQRRQRIETQGDAETETQGGGGGDRQRYQQTEI